MPSIHQTSAATGLPSRAIELTGPSGRSIPATVTDVGVGLPVVFLHGLVGLNEHWENVVLNVKDQLRCITLQMPLLDLRDADCSIQGVTEITMRFLEEYLPNEPARLVGNSFGGHVALRIALIRPDLVHSLVLAGASGLMEKTMVRAMAHGAVTRHWVEEKIGELFYNKAAMKRSDVDRAYAELSDRERARAMVRLSRTARKNHLGEHLPDVRQPTLLIWGRNDVVTPPQAAEEFLELLPDAKLVWLSDCGHAPMIESPERFAEAMLAWDREVSERGPASE